MLSQDRRLAGASAFGNLADDPPARPTGDFALNLPNTEVGGRGKCLDRQATEMSWYPAAQEITWICADFVMELRGFEPVDIHPHVDTGVASKASYFRGHACRPLRP